MAEGGRQYTVLRVRVGDGYWENGHASKLEVSVNSKNVWSGTWGQ